MSLVLFLVASGNQVALCVTEHEARQSLRNANSRLGWTKISSAWHDGYECELCTNGTVKDYGPYAITEFERWSARFAPENLTTKELELSVDFLDH